MKTSLEYNRDLITIREKSAVFSESISVCREHYIPESNENCIYDIGYLEQDPSKLMVFKVDPEEMSLEIQTLEYHYQPIIFSSLVLKAIKEKTYRLNSCE